MKISLVLMSRNEEKFVKTFFQNLKKQIRKPDEIILVDSSTDKTPELAKPYVTKIIKTPPKGCADARLRGQEKARGDIIVFTDIDAIPDKNWLKEIENMFQSPSVKVVVGMVTFDEIPSKLRADSLNGCNMAFRKEILEKFKWDTTQIGEDIDMGYRLIRAGYRIYPCEKAVVYHKGTYDDPKFTHIRAGRCMALLLCKYRTPYWFARICYNILYALRIGKPKYAYWMTYSFIFNLYDIVFKKRKTPYIFEGYAK